MDLAELILYNKGDRSYETLARDCGGTPTSQRLQQLGGRTGRPAVNFPDPPSIRGLARGLRVTELTVVLAAAETLDLDVNRALPRLVEQLPPGTEQLTDQEIAAVVTMIRTMLGGRGHDEAAMRAEMGVDDDAAPQARGSSTERSSGRRRRAG